MSGNNEQPCKGLRSCKQCKVVEQVFNLGPGIGRVASLRHHLASLLDVVDDRNKQLNIEKQNVRLSIETLRMQENLINNLKSQLQLIAATETENQKLKQSLGIQTGIVNNLQCQMRLIAARGELQIVSEKMKSNFFLNAATSHLIPILPKQQEFPHPSLICCHKFGIHLLKGKLQGVPRGPKPHNSWCSKKGKK